MKNRIVVLAATTVLVAASSFARTEFLTLPAGRTEVYDVGFTPKGRKITGKELVTVSVREGMTTATLTAGEVLGNCQVEFIDAGGGEGLLLNIEVVGDLDDTLRSLRKWLADFNDLEFRKGKSKIAIIGTIGTPADWAKFQKVCALSDFKDKVESVVEFSIDPATINELRKELVAEGVPLVAEGQTPGEGQVAMSYKHNVLNFTGTVYSKSEVDKIVRALKGRPWLKVVSEAKDAATSTVAQAVVGVDVDDSLLELGVAFVLVSKNAVKERKSSGRVIVDAVWDGVKDLVLMGGHRTSQHGSYDNVTLSSNLRSTLSLLAGEGVVRQREYGTMRFHANGQPGAKLHIGGTMTVTPQASGEGEAPETQDYDYGFMIENKNTRRIAADIAEVDVMIELFGAPEFQNAGGPITVNQRKQSVSPLVRVPIGKTVAVAGYESLFENTVGPTGTPLLRNIPILNWFVSDKKEESDDLALLFLVSVRKVDVEGEAPMVENTPMKDVTLDANTPNAERIKKDRDELKKKRGGCTPLTWFRW